jgi:hypothetical protein
MKIALRYLSLLLVLTTLGWANDHDDNSKKQCKKPTHQTDNDGKSKHEHDPVPTPTPGPVTSYSGSGASSTSTSTSSSSSNQTQGQQQSQGQTQVANGGNATATGGTSSASNGAQSNQQVSTYNQVRQAPPAFAPDVFSTAPCRVGGSVGASSPFGGLALGGSKGDKDCVKVQLANGFFERGNPVAACKLLLSVKAIKGIISMEDCLVVNTPEPVATTPVVAPVVPSITVNVPAPVLTPILTVQAEKPQVITVVAPKQHVAKRKPATPITCDQAVTKYCAVPPATVKPTAAKPQATNLCPIIYRDGVKIIMERA